jgi:predicted dinucleotide-binding enzyme
MNIGVLGSGVVGETLANGFLKKGHEVMRGSREPRKLSDWKAKAGSGASTGTFAEAAAHGELVVLAVKGSAAEEAVRACGGALSGKPVIDTTNPIADEKPDGAVLRFFTGPNESLMERLQKLAPQARFVKAFSCVGNTLMVDPRLKEGAPTMFMCGDDPKAKQRVQDVLQQFGWEWADMGEAAAARAIEPLCMLWCIPGFRENSWGHAFKLLRS